MLSSLYTESLRQTVVRLNVNVSGAAVPNDLQGIARKQGIA